MNYIRSQRVTQADFEIKKKIAEGTVAEVGHWSLQRLTSAQLFLCTHSRLPTKPLVMKRMKKKDVLARTQVTGPWYCSSRVLTLTIQSVCYTAELECLVELAAHQDTVVQKQKRSASKAVQSGIERIHFAFQSEHYLSLITDYYPGGDLLGLLGKYDRFPEVRVCCVALILTCS